MNSDEQPEYIANKIKELHSNIRHVTQLAMSWFAFFVTVNYLTMGWLAKRPSSPDESVTSGIISVLAVVFIVQNLFGMVGLRLVLKAAAAMKNEVNRLENLSFDKKDDLQKCKLKNESIPTDLYNGIGISLIIVLGLLAGAWGIIAFGNR